MQTHQIHACYSKKQARKKSSISQLVRFCIVYIVGHSIANCKSMDGRLGFYGILSMQIVAISCQNLIHNCRNTYNSVHRQILIHKQITYTSTLMILVASMKATP